MDVTDEDVVRRVRDGETALFEVILRRHNQRLFRTARAILRNDAEAEDAVQEAYISAYQHLGQFHGDARFSTWLTRICIRAALGRARAAGRRAEVDVNEEIMSQPDPEDPERAAAGRELRGVVESAVDRLPDIYRLTFMLREVQQLSTAEAAECLEVSEEVVKIRLHRAKGMLREALSQQLDAAARDSFAFLGERCDRIVASVMERLRHLSPPR